MRSAYIEVSKLSDHHHDRNGMGPQAIFVGLYAPVQENLKKSSGAREACRAARRRVLVWLAQASAGTRNVTVRSPVTGFPRYRDTKMGLVHPEVEVEETM
jgi:hypothetical protein